MLPAVISGTIANCVPTYAGLNAHVLISVAPSRLSIKAFFISSSVAEATASRISKKVFELICLVKNLSPKACTYVCIWVCVCVCLSIYMPCKAPSNPFCCICY